MRPRCSAPKIRHVRLYRPSRKRAQQFKYKHAARGSYVSSRYRPRSSPIPAVRSASCGRCSSRHLFFDICFLWSPEEVTLLSMPRCLRIMRGKIAPLNKYPITVVQVTPPRRIKIVGGIVNQAGDLCPFSTPFCPLFSPG